MDPFSSPAFLFGGIPVFNLGGIRKQQRAQKASATKAATKAAASVWAESAALRPFSVEDLAPGAAKCLEAFAWYSDLSLADVKSECAMHGLKMTGAKYKLVDSLVKLASKKPNVKRGEVDPSTLVGAPPKLPAHGADRVRRALVADLRAGLVFDKKLKKGGNKMFKAHYANCSTELFAALFPHAGSKRKCAVEIVRDLHIDRLGKGLRYGGSLEHVAGSLSAQIDDAGTISVGGKYTMM